MRSQITLLATIAALTLLPPARAHDVLLDTLYIVDESREDNAIADTIGGYQVWGRVVDMQVCDDFYVPEPGYYLDSFTADYIGYLGREPDGGMLIEIFEDLGGYPAETPYWSYNATGIEVSVNMYSHYWGGVGYRITTELYSNFPELHAGNWFISQTPVDTTQSADGYFHFREYEIYYGADSYVRDSGADHGTDYPGFYGSGDWIAAEKVNYGPGESSVQITGHALEGHDHRGDLNCDDKVDFNDIDPFVVAIIGQAEYESQYPDCDYDHADINKDGFVDFNDIDPFVDCLINGGCK